MTSTPTPRTLPNLGLRIYSHSCDIHTYSKNLTQSWAANLQLPKWPPHLLQEPHPIQGSESAVTRITSTPTPRTLNNPGQRIYSHLDDVQTYFKNLTQSTAANLHSPRWQQHLHQEPYPIKCSESAVTQMTSTPPPRTLLNPGPRIYTLPDDLHIYSKKFT